MARQEKYFLGPDLLSDIRRTIARTDSNPIGGGPWKISTRYSDIDRFGDAPLFRGTYTVTSWAVGQTAPVVIQGQTNTVAVTNYCTPILRSGGSTAPLNVLFGEVMGTMTAVEIQQPTCTMSIGGVDLTQLPGYDPDTVQLLGHAQDTETTACLGLQWYSVTQCGA